MTRYDYYRNLIEECRGYDEDLDWVVNDDELAVKLIKHEQDTLKEFVEWLKERLKEQYTRLYNGEGSDIVRSIGVHIVLANLDTHLEKFLEDRK